LPNRALTEVNRSPVSCMPSPESPANRTTTCEICSLPPGSRWAVSVIAASLW